MTKQIRLFVFMSFIAMLFLSCDNPKKEVSQKSNDNIERINTFIKNNKAIENWSSFFKQKHPFTYHYDEFISHYKDSLLYFRGYVDDIVKNDSNYEYQDYYDYWGLNLKTTGVFYFTKKFYSIINFSYTRKSYDERKTADSVTDQKDNLYVASFLLAYDITSSCTISADYTYRDNQTNQPFDKYSGSVYTISVNYAF